MKRIEFIRSTGRWLMAGMFLAVGGYLVASRRISLQHFCAAHANCRDCGLKKHCCLPDKNEIKQDGEG